MPKRHIAGTMSTRLPCCLRVFYNYPSWRTRGSPFVSQVHGYLKTHINHSFVTILNYKTVRAKPCRSSIMNIPPVHKQPNTFKFPQRSFGQKNPMKRSFQPSWFANRTWANNLAYRHICMVAYRDRKLNISNLDKASMVFWKDAKRVF